MYERFTDRARKVMQLANQEAQRFNHEYIGTEHILLGLVKEGEGAGLPPGELSRRAAERARLLWGSVSLGLLFAGLWALLVLAQSGADATEAHVTPPLLSAMLHGELAVREKPFGPWSATGFAPHCSLKR